jgi:uncharacterized protein YycO
MSTCTPYSLLIGLHRAPGVFGRLIRWQTRSDYSHASLYCVGLGVIEAREGKGVHRMPGYEPKRGEVIELYRVNAMTDEEMNSAWTFAASQIGKAYDWTMVARFVTRRQESRPSSEKWFCSELVYAAFHHAGHELLRATQPWEVSPGLLARSPYLSLDHHILE